MRGLPQEWAPGDGVLPCQNGTVNTAMVMKEMAQQNGETALFLPEDNNQYGQAKSAIEKSRNRQLKELFNAGFAMHHASMLRESICQLMESSSRELRSKIPNMDPLWMLVYIW